jgi:hypothetical protein
MSKTERVIDVEVDGADVKVIVKKPSNAVMSAAQRKGALVWTQCIQEGVMTKQELEALLETRGIWTKEKKRKQQKILDEISALEKSLYLGPRGSKLKTSEGKRIAIEMRKKRIELRDLLAQKVTLEQNTAESLSDNAKFDYIVAHCTYDSNEQKVYESLDDYSNRNEDPIAFAAAQALAEMMYSLDKNFEENLPENRFLKKFEYINDDMHLVNSTGHKVDTEGRLINDEGHYINDEGERVDIDGHLLNEDGIYVPTHEFEVDDKPKPKRKTTTRKKPAAATKEAEAETE